MNFRERSLGSFLDARNAASDLLQQIGVQSRLLTFDEALVMQATAETLQHRGTFYGLQIAELVDIRRGGVYRVLHRFEGEYEILKSCQEATAAETDKIAVIPHSPRRLYAATALGTTVFNLFSTTE